MNTGKLPQSLPLNRERLAQAVELLGAIDADLARIGAELGPPPLWRREPGFATLVHIILEQQVSLYSALAAFKKLEQALGTVEPGAFLTLDDAQLKIIGFSRQKTAYCRGLAQAVLAGELDLHAMHGLEDEAVRAALTRLKGVGNWSADIYLMEVLLRPDIWPTGDLALATAVQRAKSLPARPNPQQLEAIAEPWRPYRAVAARMFWHSYLAALGPNPWLVDE
jgi:DNA-3-methyladenine glycosylase II